MRSEEVVVSDEKDSESNGAVEIFEPASGSCVKLIGAVESFDKLLERSKLLAFRVVIA